MISSFSYSNTWIDQNEIINECLQLSEISVQFFFNIRIKTKKHQEQATMAKLK